MSNDRRTTLAEISVSFRVVASRTTLEYHHGVGRAHTIATMGTDSGNVASVDERNRMVIREEEENAHSATTIVSSSGCTGSSAPSIKN